MTIAQGISTEALPITPGEQCDIRTKITALTEYGRRYRTDLVEVRPFDDKTVLLTATNGRAMAFVREDGFTSKVRYLHPSAIGIKRRHPLEVEFIGPAQEIRPISSGEVPLSVIEPRLKPNQLFPVIKDCGLSEVALSECVHIQLSVDLLRVTLDAIQPMDGPIRNGSDDVSIFVNPADDKCVYMFCAGGLAVIMQKMSVAEDETLVHAQEILDRVRSHQCHQVMKTEVDANA